MAGSEGTREAAVLAVFEALDKLDVDHRPVLVQLWDRSEAKHLPLDWQFELHVEYRVGSAIVDSPRDFGLVRDEIKLALIAGGNEWKSEVVW